MKSEQPQRSQSTKKGTRPGAPPQVSPTPHAAGRAREAEPRERAENEGMPAPEGRASSPQVEGEGSNSATHHSREGVERSMKKGDTERLAEEAARALGGPEGEELRHAEKDPKQGHASPAPAHKKPH